MNSEQTKILMLEDQLVDEELISRELRKAGIQFISKRVETEEGFIREINEFNPDIILSDYKLPSFDGISALSIASETCPETPFIIVSGTISEDRLIEIMKSGATDYVNKDRLQKLVPSLKRALKDAQNRLEKINNEANLYALIENTDNVIWSINNEFELITFNSVFKKGIEKINNISPKVGMKIDEILSHYKEKDWITFYKRALKGEKITVEEKFKFQGTYVYHETSYSPIILNDKITGVTVYAKNISERKRSQQQIIEQAALLDLTPDAIVVCDMEYKVLYWNKGAEKLYQWTQEEAIGQKLEDLYCKQFEDQLEKAKKDLLTQGKWHGELNNTDKVGKKILVVSKWILMRDNNGEGKSVLIVNSDITEKRETETQFLRAQRMESIGSLANGIAHDLNNILAPILMASDILKRKITDSKILKVVSTIESSANRGSDIIKQILSFSRGTQTYDTLNANNIIKEIENMIRGTFPKSIVPVINVQEDNWKILADKTQLYQVLLNLCVNARDAMANGGKLTISAENVHIDKNYSLMQQTVKEGKYLVISISDTGEGIPPEMINKIFESFFTTKEVGKGTGIGLSTVDKIVKNHKGFINVYSEVGNGTVFKIFLPAVISDESQDSKDEIIEIPLGSGQMILVVDDEAAIREITRETLEIHGGYNVILANEGSEAISLYRKNMDTIKVVIMDMNMPVLDGLSAIKILKEINPDLKIIGVSGLSENHKNVKELTNSFIEKPFTAHKLLKTISELINN